MTFKLVFWLILGLRELVKSNLDEIEKLAISYSTCPLGTSLPDSSLRCHALTVENTLCMRVNTVPLYMEANRMVGGNFASN